MKTHLPRPRILFIGFAFCAVLFAARAASAQTGAFTYQGRLNDASLPANGAYDFEFRLFDSAGAQVGVTATREDVAVTDGIFTVTLDFGTSAFPGAERTLEIAVRPGTDTGAFTTLAPRQPVTSTPYAVRARNAGEADNLSNSCIGCVDDGKISTVDAAKITGTVASANYAANADRLDNIDSSGFVQTNSSSFIRNQTTAQTADFNITGAGSIGGNLGIGTQATASEVLRAVGSNGSNGLGNNAGSGGKGVTLQGGNGGRGGSVLVTLPGGTVTFPSVGGSGGSGASLTLQGGNGGLSGATSGNRDGSGGSIMLQPGAGNPNGRVLLAPNAGDIGIGTDNPSRKLHVVGNSLFNGDVTLALSTGNVGIGTDSPERKLHVAGNARISGNTRIDGAFSVGGTLAVDSLGSGGTLQLCRNSDYLISSCSSSLRYKTNVQPFHFGMSFINQLRPIAYDWKAGGMKDVGFGAEDIARINPLFVNHNAAGEVEGVKYDRLSVVFVNAFKEQQAQIETQRTQIETQEKQINELKGVVCALKPDAAVCKEMNR